MHVLIDVVVDVVHPELNGVESRFSCEANLFQSWLWFDRARVEAELDRHGWFKSIEWVEE